MLTFLRRDPVAYVTLVEAALVLAVSWGWFGLTLDLLPLIMAVVSGAFGVIVAIYTKRTGFAVAIGLVKAVIALMAGYGLMLSDNQTAAIIGFSVVVLGFFNWTQTSPAIEPGLHEEPMVVEGEILSTLDEPSPYTPPSVQP
jgi:tetrahydromethanopterin S-methyltransferase subunit C